MATKFFISYRFLLCLFLVILSTSGFSQRAVLALDTGKRLPDITITHFFEQPGKQLRTAELKGKLLILDFWNTRCSACLSGMPEMDSLQKTFDDKIKILLVTQNKADEVKKLFDRIGMREKIKHLEVVTDDTVFNQLFPHQGDPHHVWIDPDGIYRYGTFFYNATGDNIEKMIRRQQIQVTQREKTEIIDTAKPLIGQIQGKIYSYMDQYSVFLKETNGLMTGGFRRFYTDSITQQRNAFSGINLSPIELLQSAFNHDVYGHDWGVSDFRKNDRIIISVKNPLALYPPKVFFGGQWDAWEKQNSICYEVKVENFKNLYVQMQSDLNRYLPYRGKVEKRIMPCYVISIKGNTDSLKVISGTKRMVKFDKGKVMLRNTPISLLANTLESLQKTGSPFIVDNTGYRENINVTFSVSAANNPEVLAKELKKYGLKMEKKNLEVNMLVVYDN